MFVVSCTSISTLVSVIEGPQVTPPVPPPHIPADNVPTKGQSTSRHAAETTIENWDQYRTHTYDSPGDCGYTRRIDVFKPVIAAVNGWAVAAGLENALLADIRIASENAVFGALERRWNIVAGDGMTVRLPLAVGYAKAMELIITGRPVDAAEAERIGLANEVVPEGRALERALELAHQIAEPHHPFVDELRREQKLIDEAVALTGIRICYECSDVRGAWQPSGQIEVDATEEFFVGR